MVELPANKYIEEREGGYYIAGTRIGLAVLVEEFRGGESPEAILQSYPSIGSLCKVYGAITFVLENPEGIECYLRDQGRLWQELREKHPLPAAFVTRSFKPVRARLENPLAGGRMSALRPTTSPKADSPTPRTL